MSYLSDCCTVVLAVPCIDCDPRSPYPARVSILPPRVASATFNPSANPQMEGQRPSQWNVSFVSKAV